MTRVVLGDSVPRPLLALLLLPALVGCAERCPDAPAQPVFGGGFGVECDLLTLRDGHPVLACFKRCPPRAPADGGRADEALP